MTTRLMKALVAGSLGLVLMLVLAACGGGDPTATPVPAATPTEGADPFVAKWDALIAAAQAEGEISTFGFDEESQAITLAAFEEKFGITVVNSDGSGRQQAERIMAERSAGQYTMDIWTGGTGTASRTLIPAGVLEPIPPLLFHPEVIDEDAWQFGLVYMDDERQYLFAYLGRAEYAQITYNTDLFDTSEITSFWDLLDPKWKGKMVAPDPRAGGASAHTSFYYLHPEIGPEFTERLWAEQEIVIAPDQRTMAEWLAAGLYPLNVWGGGREVTSAMRDGLPVKDFFDGPLKEVGDVRIGSGALYAMADAANPNAQQLFLNWYLTREGQSLAQTATGNNSFRIDIPKDDVTPSRRMDPAKDYLFFAIQDGFLSNEAAAIEHLLGVLTDAGY